MAIIGTVPEPAGVGAENVFVATQSTCPNKTPDGSVISAAKVTLQPVTLPTLAGLTVRLVIVGPVVSTTLNDAALDVPPPGGGVKTVIVAVVTAAMSVAGMAAVSCVGLTKVVVRLPPFHCTTDPGEKFEPLTVRLNPEPPACAVLGLRPLMPGMPGVGVKVGGTGVGVFVAGGTGVSGGRQRCWKGS